MLTFVPSLAGLYQIMWHRAPHHECHIFIANVDNIAIYDTRESVPRPLVLTFNDGS